MVVLDTNVIIDHIRRSQNTKTILDAIETRASQGQLALSMISVQELFVGRSTRDEKKVKFLLFLLGTLNILPYSHEIAQRAGEIVRDLNRSIEFPDAAIAATALIHGAELATLNKKDFRGITDLRLYPI